MLCIFCKNSLITFRMTHVQLDVSIIFLEQRSSCNIVFYLHLFVREYVSWRLV